MALQMRTFQGWCESWLVEALRVLKPGGHLLAFGGTRTWHRLAVAVEDAGFEVRDSIAWLYGSGFPKSLNLTGERQGWGTALKPAFEPIVVARKPLVGTVAANVLAHGTGALNIDGTRVQGEDAPEGRLRHGGGSAVSASMAGPLNPDVRPAAPAGRWPANVLLDGDAAEELDEQSGTTRSGGTPPRRGPDRNRTTYGTFEGQGDVEQVQGSSEGGPSRYFPTFSYQAKAPTRERPIVVAEDGTKTAHPTVKPLALMRWLVRLVTPPGGTVLDTFAGSGATIEAAIEEGFYALGIEREADYLPLIQIRLDRTPEDGEGAA
jgi:site-specific DNA-methyltransferase (adenine-specific)